MPEEIKTAAVIGLGALGTLYADLLDRRLPKGNFSVIMSKDRIARCRAEGVSINGRPLDLLLKTPEEGKPVDLILFATKIHGLPSAIRDAAPFVGENTLLVSILNGITSEDMLIEAFGPENVLYSVVWGMSAVKLGGNLECGGMGTISLGEADSRVSPRLQMLTGFLRSAGFSVEVPQDIRLKQWSKMMLNAGINQATAVFDCTYAGVQSAGKPRELMLAAMREAMAVANAEGIPLGEQDIAAWMTVVDGLDPPGSTSMRQDLMAGRKTELDLFAGAILALGKKHGIQTPVNAYFFDTIRNLEPRV
jgi:2-dehydropantoate 2-reductase